ncbi:MAG: Asp23/Gls24 family envelope stress response protein [Longispora sp.]|nr:Asp23/Gls24 family envelope stress response protein [Longispora sp. (in: high G+C Gram-positive bacteria)]
MAVPDVVRLHAGRFGEVATYLPARRVTGIKLGEDLIEVHVVVAGQVPIRVTAQLIHAAVATLVATPVHVYVQDVA